MKPKLRIQSLALISLLFAFAGCNSAPPTGGGGANSAPAAGVISASDKPLDVLTRAIRAQLDAKSYRARIDTSGSNQVTSTQLVEYVKPDRFHVTDNLTSPALNGDIHDEIEYFIVGEDMFMRFEGRTVRENKFSVGKSGRYTPFHDPKVIEELTERAEIKFLWPATLDGMPMLVYQYTLDKVDRAGVASITKTWVAVSDGQLRKSESDSESGGVIRKTVTTFYDYDADIKIELPTK